MDAKEFNGRNGKNKNAFISLGLDAASLITLAPGHRSSSPVTSHESPVTGILVGFRAGLPHDRAPFHDLALKKGRQLGGRGAHRLYHLRGKPLARVSYSFPAPVVEPRTLPEWFEKYFQIITNITQLPTKERPEHH